MKKIFKMFGIIAFVAIIGFSYTACEDDSGGDNVPVTGITLNQSSLSLKKGEKATLIATVTPVNATNKKVTWWSAWSGSFLNLTQNGEITAVGVGTTTITVMTADGNKTATCSVTITGNTPEKEVTNIVATTPVDGQVTLTWINPTYEGFKAVRYHYYNYTSGESSTLSKGVQTFTIENMRGSVEYVIILKTVDDSDNESDGVFIKVTPTGVNDITPPAEVTNLQFTTTENSVTFTWTDPTDEDLRTVIVILRKGYVFIYSYYLNKGEQTLTCDNLESKTEYTFGIYTMDKVGNQSGGVEIKAKTK